MNSELSFAPNEANIEAFRLPAVMDSPAADALLEQFRALARETSEEVWLDGSEVAVLGTACAQLLVSLEKGLGDARRLRLKESAAAGKALPADFGVALIRRAR